MTTGQTQNEPSSGEVASADRERIVVAMSGGVDSSVAAALLAREDFDVVGVTMQLSGDASRCCSLEDADDARRVADRLGVRFFVANYADRFLEEVIERFADDYLQGRTPIPCVTCNSRFKFDHLLARASAFGADQVATGHYARIEIDAKTGAAHLFRARDRNKDQSYFLFELTQEQLLRARFPLGDMHKDEVRKLARELGLGTADKPESQEICFVPDGDYAAVVETLRPEAKALRGEFVDREGRVLGTHRGIHHYTVGQRHGLGIDNANRPLYVSRIDAERGRIVVGDREELEVSTGRVERVNWIAGNAPAEPVRAQVQIRHRHAGALTWLHPEAEARVRVAFDEPVEAFTPGQAAVFYDAEGGCEVLGGGWIAGPIR
ncbi:MAG: tRNA 2-thiouridine(34) synthase MnmA [Myxococcota bacterium]|jgi:tRNA-specific 2-thiouridylase|nr:tRNA 2-thiouridine(34) synthase MnmA [Myxococcota bacterium]